MKKLISLMLALMMIVSACAFAAGSISSGSIASPSVSVGSVSKPKADVAEEVTEPGLSMADVLSALKGEEEPTAYDAVKKTAADETVALQDFNLTLQVIQPEMPIYALLQEIAAFTAETPISEFLGEEAVVLAQPLLPEDADPAGLMLDELYQLIVSGYDLAYGDISAAFEFVTEYEEDIVLLAAAGLLPAEDAEDQAILWLPMQAEVVEGRVQIQLSAQALETANAGQQTVAFALLQLEAKAE